MRYYSLGVPAGTISAHASTDRTQLLRVGIGGFDTKNHCLVGYWLTHDASMFQLRFVWQRKTVLESLLGELALHKIGSYYRRWSDSAISGVRGFNPSGVNVW